MVFTRSRRARDSIGDNRPQRQQKLGKPKQNDQLKEDDEPLKLTDLNDHCPGSIFEYLTLNE